MEGEENRRGISSWTNERNAGVPPIKGVELGCSFPLTFGVLVMEGPLTIKGLQLYLEFCVYLFICYGSLETKWYLFSSSVVILRHWKDWTEIQWASKYFRRKSPCIRLLHPVNVFLSSYGKIKKRWTLFFLIRCSRRLNRAGCAHGGFSVDIHIFDGFPITSPIVIVFARVTIRIVYRYSSFGPRACIRKVNVLVRCARCSTALILSCLVPPPP